MTALFCLASRNSRSIRAHKQRSTAVCLPYHRHRLSCSTRAQDSYRRKQAACTELSSWIKADRRLRSIHPTLRLSRARSASKMCTCSSHRRRRLTRQMLPHRRCTRAICRSTALYVNLCLTVFLFCNNLLTSRYELQRNWYLLL